MTVRLVLALLAALATSPAWAQPIDMSSGGPVEVTARDGFEWHESDQTVIASGDARAVRGNVTVLADRLVAHYRKKAAAAQPVAAAGGDEETGSNEIYQLDAVGHVRIVTPTDEAVGDKAVYDIDQAVLVMTGHAMRLTTPQYVMTARDSMEYWSQLHMAVGRGHALVVAAADGRRLSADVLVGYTTQGAPAAGSPAPGPARPAAAPLSDADVAGKLERVEAFGNVEVRTATDTVRGDRGVYLTDSGLARVVGNVQVVHGQNVITGPAADVNMKTGIAHVVSDPTGRVQGLIMPNQAPGTAAPAGPGKPAAPAGRAP
jgi:lipopolysaccharide export system protein LptA